MTTLDRSGLKASPANYEDFLASVVVPRWAEWPQPAGLAGGNWPWRIKFWSGGTSPSSRGCGLNSINNDPDTSESQIYSNYGYKIGNTSLRSPVTQNADDTFTITSRPILSAEADAVATLDNGGMRTRPKYLSGMLASDFKGFGLWEIRVRYATKAPGDWLGIYLQTPPSCPRNEIDYEVVACDPTQLNLNVQSELDAWYGVKPRSSAPTKFTHDTTTFKNYQILRTHEQIVFAIDDQVVRTVGAGHGCYLPMQLVVNLAKDGGWNAGNTPPSIGDGTETSSIDLDFIKFWEMK
jgi:beta-glucanase (GH16 family)